MLRGVLSLLYQIDHLLLEAGYGQWMWGRGVRVYKEPFVGMGYSF